MCALNADSLYRAYVHIHGMSSMVYTVLYACTYIHTHTWSNTDRIIYMVHIYTYNAEWRCILYIYCTVRTYVCDDDDDDPIIVDDGCQVLDLHLCLE